MAYKLVKYRLTAEGTIPTWLKRGVPQGTGGMYPVEDSSTASPRDWIILGIAEDGADISSAISEITSKDDLITYLTSVSDGWIQMTRDGSEEDFVPETAATRIWNDLETLNG